ncbi:MAG: ferrous iron transport protein B [Candidatus Eisenbacteria bacterium]|nr:ferrous iron transport protein B [Candidatus Eisenbacteria bacterium]
MAETGRVFRIALAGNPNSGKTSLFNLLTGLRQQVGNWPGVTVERKTGRLQHAGRDFEIIDLPGTYSLTPYTLEERIAREYILEQRPDVVINVVDSANLDRNLYLTVQLLEMGVDVVVALNMWDEFQRSGSRLDLERFETLLGTPAVPTEGHRGRGRQALLDAVARLLDDGSRRHRHVPVTYGAQIERHLGDLTRRLSSTAALPSALPERYVATKLLEGDPHIAAFLHNQAPTARPLLADAERLRTRIRAAAGDEPSDLIAEGRAGFVAGLLREVRSRQRFDRMEQSRNLDRILTHRWLGFPIFVLFMWLLFNATFVLGAYPRDAIEWLVGAAQAGLVGILPPGALRDLLVEGVIGGVGSVAVFLPNILLLFLGVSLLEDSGYMARSAFIMDRVMHLLGLHGKSFIPMLMGFGCSVPAIMATRTLENRRDRILTALLVPHMSCSARLPVYILIAGAFFGRQAGNVVASIYLIGIVVAVLIGRLFSRTLFRDVEAPFVMELPPYRWPTLRGLLMHMWERSRHYLKKMGGVILLASIVLWVLSNFPAPPPERSADSSPRPAVSYSVVGRLGQAIEPVIEPLGLNWRMGVTLIAGFVAKEVVVSSLAVLYETETTVAPTDDGPQPRKEDQRLPAALRDPERGISPLAAFAFMVFVLLYTPCIVAVLTIRRELGAGWMWFDVGYQLALAWLVALLIYQGGRLVGLG